MCAYLKRPGSSRSSGSGVTEAVCCLIECRGGSGESERDNRTNLDLLEEHQIFLTYESSCKPYQIIKMHITIPFHEMEGIK